MTAEDRPVTRRDETYAKLCRALYRAESTPNPDATKQVLTELVTPLALASIALELRDMRLGRRPPVRRDALGQPEEEPEGQPESIDQRRIRCAQEITADGQLDKLGAEAMAYLRRHEVRSSNA